MPSPYSRPYKTGTVSIENGSTALVGTGTAWQVSELNPLLMEGDDFYCNGLMVPIASIDSNSTATLELPWPGTDLEDAEYCIVKRSLKRFSPAEAQDRATKFLLQLEGMTPVYHVEADEDEPDPSRGEEGDLALKWSTAGAKFWRFIEGAWVEQGTLGINLKGSLADVGSLPSSGNVINDAYLIDGFIHVWNGSAWVQLATGDTYAIGFAIKGKPDIAELLEGHIFVDDVQFTADFAGSQAVARIAPTSDAEFTVLKNGISVGTITFAATETTATFDTSGLVEFDAGDELDLQAPSPRDATLSGIKITLRGFRSV